MEKLIVYSHNLNEVEITDFFLEPNYGWCFGFYDIKDGDSEKEGISSYGIFDELIVINYQGINDFIFDKLIASGKEEITQDEINEWILEYEPKN